MVSNVSVRNYSIITKSIRGASHVRSGKPNQDSFKIAREEQALILAVADGHGSNHCPYSKSGSIIAVNVFCKIMSEYCRQYADNFDALRVLLSREGDTAITHSIDAEWKCRVEIASKRRGFESVRVSPDGTDKADIWRLYGTTLLGLVITPEYYFAFQLGDGDILFLDDSSAKHILHPEKLLGTETHSLSRPEAWRYAVTTVGPHHGDTARCAFMIATDGFANSYSDEATFLQTCEDYHAAIKEYGTIAVECSLKRWLQETSVGGSGDDITVVFSVAEQNSASNEAFT